MNKFTNIKKKKNIKQSFAGKLLCLCLHNTRTTQCSGFYTLKIVQLEKLKSTALTNPWFYYIKYFIQMSLAGNHQPGAKKK